MDKVFTFLTITLAISLLMYFAGYGENNSVGTLLSLINGQFTDTPFWKEITIIFIAVAGLVTLGSAIAGNSSAAITSGTISMAGILTLYVSDIVAIINMAGQDCTADLAGLCGVVYYLIFFVLSIVAFGFAYSLFQFGLGGGD